MRAVYVYYRIDPAHAGEAANRIDTLLRAMAPYCATPPRKMHRCDDSDTWMEIYEGIADWEVFRTRLEHEAHHCGAGVEPIGERHLECFETFEEVTE
ncbi:MAG: DUF4936 family protein [Pseudomonadota bacterium]